MKTLITAANSAEAQRLKNKLGADDVILGDYEQLPAFMLKQQNLIQLPIPSSASYTHEMLTLCLDKNIDTVYALREQEILLLKQASQLFAEYNIEIVHGP